MRLIRTEEEFVRALSIRSLAADFDLLESQQTAVVENYIVQVTGLPLLETLKEKIDQLHDLDAVWKELQDRLQRSIALFCYLRSVPLLDVNARAGGFTVNMDDHSAPASKNRVNEFKKALWIKAQESMNNLVSFLDKNRDAFVQYKDSAAEKRRFSNFVNVFDDWNDSVQHHAGDWVIDRMRPTISEVEENLRVVLCNELFDYLKTKIKERSIDFEGNEVLLPIICRYVCNATMAQLITRNAITVTGARAYMSYEEGDDASHHTRPPSLIDRESFKIIYSNSAAAALKLLRKTLIAGDFALWSNSPCAQLNEPHKPVAPNGIFPAFGIGR